MILIVFFLPRGVVPTVIRLFARGPGRSLPVSRIVLALSAV
jgi:hypothetical protein